jgi:ATP-dependent RNA helicase DOB1
MSSKK